MPSSDAVAFLKGVQSPKARLAYVVHQIAARAGVPHGSLEFLRERVGGRFRSGNSVFELRPGTLDAWIVHPAHEKDTHRWIEDRFAGGGGVMLDVGAYCCSFSLFHRALFQRVYAFEPFPDNYRACLRNIALSGAGDRVVAINAALADQPGLSRLFVATADTHSLVASGGESIEVRVETIDRALETETALVSLIKLDIEGGEINALRGARAILDRDSPDLIVEANSADHQRALREHLGAAGYACDRVLDGRNMIFMKARRQA